jgi:hypothetical protein
MYTLLGQEYLSTAEHETNVSSTDSVLQRSLFQWWLKEHEFRNTADSEPNKNCYFKNSPEGTEEIISLSE